jgi:hypothetical protein
VEAIGISNQLESIGRAHTTRGIQLIAIVLVEMKKSLSLKIETGEAIIDDPTNLGRL